MQMPHEQRNLFLNQTVFRMERPRLNFKPSQISRRILINKFLKGLFMLTTCLTVFILLLLIGRIFQQGIGWISMSFMTRTLSIFPEKAGIVGALIGSIGLIVIVIPVTLLLGVSTAIYLEEYAKQGKGYTVIKTNISNLASVPSVIFGLLGLSLFARFLNLGASILAGGLTLSLLVLPIIVIASQEAIISVPAYLKEASYALGASKWTTLRKVVIPVALPGIITGTILAISRALGETAPLVVLGIPALIMKLPTNLMDDFTALPLQIYYWTMDAVLTPEYANLAAATILVLLSILLVLNTIAMVIRNRFQRTYS